MLVKSLSQEADRSRRRLIEDLRHRIDDILRPLIGDAQRMALLGIPRFSNVGDSALLLGELAALRSLGLPQPCYTCEPSTYSAETLRKRLGPDGVILFQAGGAFGDLWYHNQLFREQVLRDFPDHRVILLPQSIHFQSREKLAQARRAMDAHPRLMLLLRDQRSLEIARNEFQAESLLSPDLAFALGPLERPCRPSYPIFRLARNDHEAAPGGKPPQLEGVPSADWVKEGITPQKLGGWLMNRIERRVPSLRPWTNGLFTKAVTSYARMRVDRGCRLLSQGQVVLTDRLHGHILCLLLGIPHLVLDNNYGKVSGYFETWTRDCGIARRYDPAVSLEDQVRSLPLVKSEST